MNTNIITSLPLQKRLAGQVEGGDKFYFIEPFSYLGLCYRDQNSPLEVKTWICSFPPKPQSYYYQEAQKQFGPLELEFLEGVDCLLFKKVRFCLSSRVLARQIYKNDFYLWGCYE